MENNNQFEVSVKNANAYFGAFHAVKDISITFKEKTLTAAIGPSGCGKSTFLRCLNRMHEVIPGATVSGDFQLRGKPIYGNGVDPVSIRRKIGMVFQKPNPFPSMSIFENVISGQKLAGITDKKSLAENAEDALKKAALWDEVKDKLNKPGLSLSGGQQQRLCIARALAVNPPVLLMDEPTSALDPISTAKIEELMIQLKEKMTLIVVTHNMQQAARVSDRTAFFLSGELIEVDSTSQIFTVPKKQKTEQYITGRFG